MIMIKMVVAIKLISINTKFGEDDVIRDDDSDGCHIVDNFRLQCVSGNSREVM